jgi:hypothetical protein
VLIARARALHPELSIGANFESRFRKGEGKRSESAPAKAAAAGAPAAPTAQAAPQPVAAARAVRAEPEVEFVTLPPADSWNIPLRCLKCGQVHDEPVGNFMIGNVIFCPHCHKSMVVRDNLNYHIRTLLKDAYDGWEREQTEFIARRERELAEFTQKRAREAEAFQERQRKEIQRIRQQLDAIGETYDAPGRPLKRGARFGWG